jgi:hypothetical protein
MQPLSTQLKSYSFKKSNSSIKKYGGSKKVGAPAHAQGQGQGQGQGQARSSK